MPLYILWCLYMSSLVLCLDPLKEQREKVCETLHNACISGTSFSLVDVTLKTGTSSPVVIQRPDIFEQLAKEQPTRLHYPACCTRQPASAYSNSDGGKSEGDGIRGGKGRGLRLFIRRCIPRCKLTAACYQIPICDFPVT